VYAVADGLGGHSGGDVAAQRAVQAVLDFCPGAGDLAGIARAAVGLAHELVLYEQHRTGLDCRTTLALLLVRGARAVVAHVGDSRVYRLRSGVLEQLTQDHRHPAYRNVVVRALGSQRGDEDAAEPDIRELDVLPGDVFVLTTDGVHDTLAHDELRALLQHMREGEEPARRTAELLVSCAIAQGSTDNCTALVLRVPGGAP
jgi:protein phosphatase